MTSFETEWRARFERYARTYTAEAEISGWSAAGLQRRIALFCALLPTLGLPPAARILELGCGAGTYVRLLQARGHRVVGLDYSLPSLTRAAAADPTSRAQYVAADAYALPFRDHDFDLVMSIGVLQTLSAPEGVVTEMARLVRPGGVVLLEALNRRSVLARARQTRDRARRHPPRVRTYDPDEVRQWLSASDLRLVHQQALCLPPRRLPQLGRLLAGGPVAAAIDASPRLANAAAHAFWFAARKPSRGAGAAR